MVFFNLLFNIALPWAGYTCRVSAGPDRHLDSSLQWQNPAADCGAQKGLQPQRQDMLSTWVRDGQQVCPW